MDKWLLGGGILAAIIFGPKLLAGLNPTPAPSNTPAGIVAPSNLLTLMINSYDGYVATRGVQPDRSTWIQLMISQVYPLSTGAWGYIYDQAFGTFIQNRKAGIVSIANEQQVEGFFNYAANNL